MSVAATLWGDVEAHPDHDVLRLHGDLTLATVARARALIGKLLHDKGAVVVDLAGLRLRWAPAVELFPSVLAAAGGWPAARLVLTGVGAELAGRLRAVRVHSTVPIVADAADAAASLLRRPERVTRHRDLPAIVAAPGSARGLVREACADWCVSGAEDAAALVASELVTNVVQHTRSSCRVSVSIGPSGLHVSVRDYAPGVAPRPRPVELTHAGGRGLHLVAMLSSAWGVQKHLDGKTIWAVIALPS
jgi:anti-sigma regulatory factor (Ser/Thr protein kinase)